MRIGGVGWICGNPEKPGRRAEADQLALIELAAKEKPDLLILHEGPNRTPEQRGNPEIRQLLERTGVPFTACGHVHWDVPLGAHGKGQILNCDSRVMILTRPAKWTN